MISKQFAIVAQDIFKERDRQDELVAQGRFRATCASSKLSHGQKLAILGEEFGEVCRQVCATPEDPIVADHSGSVPELYRELIQVAAVASAWAEGLISPSESA